MSKDQAYEHIRQLVTRFKDLSPARRKSFNEAATRQEFILPLFSALGWNTEDTSEVSPEEKVSRGWVDFAFRIDGIPRFFLETKRISEDLSDPRWFHQAIDYSWTKGVTWAFLSDFEHLRVLNAEWKEDNPLRAEFIHFDIDSYLTDFERLLWLSREEISQGTLDTEAESVGKKVRKQPVTDQLFEDLTFWRRELFRHLRPYNESYSDAQIDEAALRILNRLIFIRTAEDRLVEEPTLLPLVRELEETKKMSFLPQRLSSVFRSLDAIYDSDLFAEHFSEYLDCEPEPFKLVINQLYQRPDGFVRYNFNAIDADILGAVYEQYLGHLPTKAVARTSAPGPKKRKHQGIYYTPAFVVQYILRKTLGTLLSQTGYKSQKPPRVLDLACGSGSFLTEAFRLIDRASADTLASSTHHKADSLEDAHRRNHILSNSIYGVDLDDQAVSVAKLNLSLENLHSRTLLPMLANIRRGNSLLSGDESELRHYFGDAWADKLPFNWEAEFPKIMNDGGFDVVVGNPPYLFGEYLPGDEKAYYTDHYSLASRQYDTYWLFYERCLALLKDGGFHGYIVPDAILARDEPQLLRDFILENSRILSISHVGRVFKDPAVSAAVIILQKTKASPSWKLSADYLTPPSTYTLGKIPQRRISESKRSVFALEKTEEWVAIENKLLKKSTPLHELISISRGEELGKKNLARASGKIPPGSVKILAGECVSRYHIAPARHYVPKTKIEKPSSTYASPKLLVVKTGEAIVAALNEDDSITLQSLYNLQPKSDLPVDINYLLGILNSQLMSCLIRKRVTAYKKLFPQINQGHLLELPIRIPTDSDASRIQMSSSLTNLVVTMNELQAMYFVADQEKTDDRHDLFGQIIKLDQELNDLVYAIYDMTDAEIAVVEASLSS